MKKLESIGSLFDEIPTPIVWDILSRLPTKACLHCKLVCKEWYSIIISLEFGAFRSSRSPFFTILLYGQFYTKNTNFLLVDLDKSSKVDDMGNLNVSPETMIRFKSKFTMPHLLMDVINECNGLVCLKCKGDCAPFIICNLLTSQQVKVKQVYKPSFTVEIFGFGCCPVSNQFKIVRLLHTTGFYKGEAKTEAEVCTIGTKKWRSIGDAPCSHLNFGIAFLHGSLHRLSYRDHCIWSFQLENEQFHLIQLPNITRFGSVNVFESCLSISSVTKDGYECEVWVMKEYGMKDSWTKVFVIDSRWYPTPIFQMNVKEMLISHPGYSGFQICDIESGKYKLSCVLDVPSFQVTACNVKFSKF